MYLIAKFEKKVKDLLKIPINIPETEKEIYDIFNEDIKLFLFKHRDDYLPSEIMKICFQTTEKIGVEIYKI